MALSQPRSNSRIDEGHAKAGNEDVQSTVSDTVMGRGLGMEPSANTVHGELHPLGGPSEGQEHMQQPPTQSTRSRWLRRSSSSVVGLLVRCSVARL